MDKKTSNAGKVAGAVGLAAAAVAAAATGYYFYGKGGKAHRKEAGEWTKKAKTEVLGKIKQMKDVTQETYNKVVEDVLAKYKKIKSIDLKELQIFGQELKAHWEQISKEAAILSGKGHAKKSSVKK
jgi:hypothetical protein